MADLVLHETIGAGDVADLYRSDDGLAKLARDPADNDLLVHEAMMLSHLHSEIDPEYADFVIKVKSSGISSDGRWANQLELAEGFHDLSAVRRAYPDGVGAKDAAWMWRRLLAALGAVHRGGVIHGAVIPEHVMIHPESHGLVLVDWCFATMHGEAMASLPRPNRAWYPLEVRKKTPPTSGLDVAMGAMSLVSVLGGNPPNGSVPDSVPLPLRAHLRGCIGSATRPTDAWRVLGDFDELIDRLWGPRRFTPFHLPSTP